ncbi:MAG: hypothetical protein ABI682_03170 [Acidobacteriota bacterium]
MRDELDDLTPREESAGSFATGLYSSDESLYLRRQPNTKDEEGSTGSANEISDSGTEEGGSENEDVDEGQDEDEDELEEVDEDEDEDEEEEDDDDDADEEEEE